MKKLNNWLGTCIWLDQLKITDWIEGEFCFIGSNKINLLKNLRNHRWVSNYQQNQQNKKKSLEWLNGEKIIWMDIRDPMYWGQILEDFRAKVLLIENIELDNSRTKCLFHAQPLV